MQLAYPVELANGPAICGFISGEYAKAGFAIECSPKPFDKLLEAIGDKTFDLALFSMTMDLPDVEYLLDGFESASKPNYSNYRSSTLDRMLADARKEADREARGRLFASINRELYENAVTINISYPQHVSYRHRCVNGLHVGLLGDAYIDYTKVSLSSDCRDIQDFK